jgi:YD repeat-containing protein
MSRLSTVTATADKEAFQYDANGNRTSQTVNGTSGTLTISPASNQVSAAAGGTGETCGYDAQGNLTAVSGGVRATTFGQCWLKRAGKGAADIGLSPGSNE